MPSRVPPAVRAQRAVTERSFQGAVIDLARTCGWLVAHFHDSRRQVAGRLVGDRDAAGFPDLVMARGGRLIFAELKADSGRLRPEQLTWLAALQDVEEETGGRVRVRIWRPSDWPEIEALLTERAA